VLDAAVDAGASVLNVPDTVGYTTPMEYTHLVQQVRERVVRDRDVIISVHCHNDLGLAVANSLAAIEAARDRLSARSTASASAPAMRRSKRS
jgi:2-isopropylmalate synthase